MTPTKTCDVPGCGNVARSNVAPHCNTHAQRVKRTGDCDPTTPVRQFGKATPCPNCQGTGKVNSGWK